MAGTFSRSLGLVKASWQVLRHDKELMLLPVLATLASALSTAPFVIGAMVAFSADGSAPVSSTAEATTTSSGTGPAGIAGIALLFVAYLIGAYVAIFFQSALVLAANDRMTGGDPTLGSALAAAWSNKGRIFGWAMISATVSIVLQALQERAGFVGRLVVGAVGLAWTLVTLLVLPVLVIEQVGVKEAFGRSAEAFKRTWGENVVGNGGIGLVSFLGVLAVLVLGVPFLILGANGSSTLLVVLGVLILVVGLVGVAVFSAALSGIFRTALYRYAMLGEEFGGFTHEQISGAFRPKS